MCRYNNGVSVIHLYDPKLEIDRLKYSAFSMMRRSMDVRTVKNLIAIWDILDLTDRINKPWDSKRYRVFADMGALAELEQRSGALLIRKDPSEKEVMDFNSGVKRLIRFWRSGVENTMT